MKEARSVLFSVTALLVVSGCGSSVDIAEQPECPVPERAVSSVEALSYARCFVPGSEDAEVIGYSSRQPHDEMSVGRFEGWAIAFRYQGVYYQAGAHVGSAGNYDWGAEPPDCAAGSIPVLDSVVLVPAATDTLSGIDPVPEYCHPTLTHGMLCLSWSWDPQANSRAVVSFFADWEGEPYRAVMFDDTGAVSRVCSKNACDGGQTEYCCDE